MKLKYYLRGVGTGILFATIILFISYSYKLSDGQIKKRAAQLGMVMQTEEQGSSAVVDKNNNDKETTSKLEENSSDNEQVSGEPTTEEPSTEEPTTEEPTTDKTENQSSSEESTSQKNPTDETTSADNTEITCVIKVTNQTGSHHVAILLKRAGIIENADEFNNYLIKNGYAYKIQNGTFTFTKGMTYEEMAKYLITGRKPN